MLRLLNGDERNKHLEAQDHRTLRLIFHINVELLYSFQTSLTIVRSIKIKDKGYKEFIFQSQ